MQLSWMANSYSCGPTSRVTRSSLRSEKTGSAMESDVDGGVLGLFCCGGGRVSGRLCVSLVSAFVV